MKFLVTGSKGQLAAEITKLLQDRALDFRALDEVELDITDLARVREVTDDFRPDVVINCAAYNAVDGAEQDSHTANMVNGVGVRNLALSCQKNDSLLVHFGTDFVFDGKGNRPYTVLDTPAPLGRYGESKLLGEMYVRDLMKRFFLIRLSWVFGMGEFSFPVKVLQWASGKKSLRVVDDQIASPSYTKHLSMAVFDLIKTEAYGVYHITNTGFCSRYEWASFILDHAGWDGKIEPAKSSEFNTPARRPAFSVLDNFPLKETIGYVLPSWQEATEVFLKEYELSQ